VTLFFLNRPAIPPVSWVTILSLRFIIVARSSPAWLTTMPWRARPPWASWYSSEDSSNALDGMQPTRRQVPPSRGSSSMHATLQPNWAARMAPV
jgi:hypothetical protein